MICHNETIQLITQQTQLQCRHKNGLELGLIMSKPSDAIVVQPSCRPLYTVLNLPLSTVSQYCKEELSNPLLAHGLSGVSLPAISK